MLAELPDAEVSEIVRRSGVKAFTPNTITTGTALKTELRAVRSRGYAIDNEEKEPGLRCVSAPVRNDSGKLLAALSVSGPAFRVTRERVPEIAKAVMQAAGERSFELGYRPTAVELVRGAVS